MQLSYDYAKDRALMCLRANYESHLSTFISILSRTHGSLSLLRILSICLYFMPSLGCSDQCIFRCRTIPGQIREPIPGSPCCDLTLLFGGIVPCILTINPNYDMIYTLGFSGLSESIAHSSMSQFFYALMTKLYQLPVSPNPHNHSLPTKVSFACLRHSSISSLCTAR